MVQVEWFAVVVVVVVATVVFRRFSSFVQLLLFRSSFRSSTAGTLLSIWLDVYERVCVCVR